MVNLAMIVVFRCFRRKKKILQSVYAIRMIIIDVYECNLIYLFYLFVTRFCPRFKSHASSFVRYYTNIVRDG